MEQFFRLQDLGAIAPELELTLFGMILLVLDLLVVEKRKIGIVALGGIAISGCVSLQAVAESKRWRMAASSSWTSSPGSSSCFS